MVKNRILWIDVLNICACLSVLLLHTNFQYLSYDGNITFSWLYGCLIFTIAFWKLTFLGTILTGQVVRIELNYFYPSSVLIPAAVLVFFRYTKWNNFFKTERVKQLIGTLSGCCLGVYFIQRLLQIIFGYYNLPGVNYLSGFVVLFIFGVLITYMMKRLPLLKNCV